MQRNMRVGWSAILICLICLSSAACKKKKSNESTPEIPIVQLAVIDTSILNSTHLDRLIVPVVFSNGDNTNGIYIYADAPDYLPLAAAGEGFTCVDDVARGALFYIRSSTFSSDTIVRNKAYGLLRFIINMQSGNGYFYNFLQDGNVINKTGITSINQPKWWSWRALQALTEAIPVVKIKNNLLAIQAEVAIDKLISAIKKDMVNRPLTTIKIKGIDVPQWLPEGADQAATLLFGLIGYCGLKNDSIIKNYIRKLADGILMTQFGDADHFPYDCFLSSGNTWHAYGNDQAAALFKTGAFLQDDVFTNKALAEVNHFYPWILNVGYKNSFDISLTNNIYLASNTNDFDQIAYGIRPMVFAAIDAYIITGDANYADIAGHLAAWFLGSNVSAANMYSVSTGRCLDGINSGNSINKNSGAESTIEALLTMQRVNVFPLVKAAMEKYKL